MRHPELWDQDKLRTTIPGSPHGQARDILMRFGKPDVDDTGPFENRPSMAILGAMATVLSVMQLVGGSELGRVMITSLPSGARILPHADEGLYARRMTRHQLMLQCMPGVQFICGGETFCAQTGDLFWFNSILEHEVINNSADDRFAMIIDVRID
jgi:hypothetical protein